MNGYDWECRFAGGTKKVKQIVGEIARFIDERTPRQTHEERGELRLIFSELLYNAVLHGNASDAEKHVHVRVALSGSTVRARITDEGSGCCVQTVIKKLRAESDIYREKGRGLLLVEALSDSLYSDPKDRSVVFVKTIGKNG
jgi:anti-sigma regulatory factor (Ser/Thr protein kinase)